MSTVLLIHQDKIQHYRIPIYNYLSEYLRNYDYSLTVVSGGVEPGNPHPIQFDFIDRRLTFMNIAKTIRENRPKAILFFVNLRNLYLFPLFLYTRLLKIKIIYWGHAINLEKKSSLLNLAYRIEHSFADSIVLYADYLKKYVHSKHHRKVFVANNTVNTTIYDKIIFDKEKVLANYGIKTSKNIICMGRFQKRKRIGDLLQAFKILDLKDVGLILAGPDTENILNNVHGDNIYIVGPVYGEDAISLLGACDLYCLPGHVGLSIVDAFYCGLPMITEDVDHAPEICYLKNGINGFIVPKGDIRALMSKIKLLLTDDTLRKSFSEAARNEVQTNAHVKTMCRGFQQALSYAFKSE